jgi:peptide/nickel transport system ATP-binding protein
MNEASPSVELLEKIEDVGGAAQPLLQVSGLTKHFPVRGDLFSARKTVRAVDNVSFSIAKAKPSASSADPAAASRPPRGF